MARTATKTYRINKIDDSLYTRAISWTGQACRVFMPLGQNEREVNNRLEDNYPGGVDGFIRDFENDDIKSAR